MGFDESVHAKAIELVKLSIDMTTAADSGHPSSAASLAHLVTALMYGHMRYSPAEPDSAAADRLVLSEGHAVPIVYAAAADIGIVVAKPEPHPLTREEVMRLRDIASPIDGHPNPAEGFTFFPAATGSLGQGLSIAAGLAAAGRLDGLDKRVFCIIGDGESREGQIWEAIDFIADYGLNTVCPIFNCNSYGQSDKVSHQQSAEVTAAKLRGAGYEVRVVDGHSPAEIHQALAEHTAHCRDPRSKPFAIVAETVKGWGFATPEMAGWHGKPLTGDGYKKAMAQLDTMAQKLGVSGIKSELKISPAPRKFSPERYTLSPVPTFNEAARIFGQEAALKKGELAPRKAYGIALRALGHANRSVVALDADVKNSTFSEYFYKDAELAERFFECRIAEQHMVSCAGGLAVGGKIPFASSFGRFIQRGYDQLEMGLISRFNMKIVGSHVGVNIAADGPSQMAMADMAFFRSMAMVNADEGGPAIYILNPADAYCAYQLTVRMAEHYGLCYMRTMRPDVKFLYDSHTQFDLGGHKVLSEGSDLLIVAGGYMVHESRKALTELAKAGIKATLVDLYSIPFDNEAIAALALKNGGRVLTVEDNYGAGLGGAVADALTAHGGSFKVRQMFVRRIPKSGRSTDDLLKYCGLSYTDIVDNATALAGARR
ncbi:MAG: transketolase [SAR202 cluster bacterium]|nr:transketolase [SAR202 cluster bacterium]